MSNSASAQKTSEMPAHVALMQMITARWISQAIAAAANLDLADHLAHGPRTVADLASATQAHAPSLYRLLRALASVGIFAEVGGTTETEAAARRFSMTPLAEPLRSDSPFPMKGAALLFDEEWRTRAWSDLHRSVQTGETAFNRVFGEGLFEYMEKHPKVLDIFHQGMKSFTALSKDAVTDAYDFSEIKTLLDVGGGNGNLLAGILKANPKMRGILYDGESVVATAKPILDAAGVTGRCTVIAGDFFEKVPPGADACILKHIIHDWDDERSVAILTNCRRALPAHGKVLVVDAVIAQGNEPSLGKLLDLEMLVMAPGGRERSEPEFRKLFATVGLRLNRVIPTASPVAILEGVPA